MCIAFFFRLSLTLVAHLFFCTSNISMAAPQVSFHLHWFELVLMHFTLANWYVSQESCIHQISFHLHWFELALMRFGSVKWYASQEFITQPIWHRIYIGDIHVSNSLRFLVELCCIHKLMSRFRTVNALLDLRPGRLNMGNPLIQHAFVFRNSQCLFASGSASQDWPI